MRGTGAVDANELNSVVEEGVLGCFAGNLGIAGNDNSARVLVASPGSSVHADYAGSRGCVEEVLNARDLRSNGTAASNDVVDRLGHIPLDEVKVLLHFALQSGDGC